MGLIGQLPRANGYVKEMIAGNMMPVATGAGDTTYWCDYFYTALPGSGSALRTVLFGGSASAASDDGLASAYTYYDPSFTSASVGSRVCFIPA
jgi:hypothetical protein